MGDWIRSRFHANEDDYRPVAFPPPGPFWCTGYGDDYSTIVAYVKTEAQITEYWPEATNITLDHDQELVFGSRFPKPDWWNADNIRIEEKT